MRIRVSGLHMQDVSEIMNSGCVHCVCLNFISGSPECVQTIPTGVGCMPDAAPRIHSDNDADALCRNKRPLLVGVFGSEMAQSIVARIHLFHLDGIQFQGDVSTVLLDNLRRTLIPDICPEIVVTKYVSGAPQLMESQCEKYGDYVDAFLLDGYTDADVLHTLRFLDMNAGKSIEVPFYVRVAPDVQRIAACLNHISHPRFEGMDIDFSLSKGVDDVLSILLDVSGML